MKLSRLEAIIDIFRKYGDTDTAAEHDEIYLSNVHPDQISVEDRELLEELGALWNDDYESWYVFT